MLKFACGIFSTFLIVFETGKAAGLFVRSAVVFIQQPGQHTFFFHNMPCGRTFIMRVVAGNIFDVAQMLAEPFISMVWLKVTQGLNTFTKEKPS